MADEQVQESATTPEVPAQTASTPPASQTPPAAVTEDWRTALDRVDAKDIRAHRRFSGLLGQELATAREQIRREIAEEHSRTAAAAAEQRLRELAKSDPLTFAEQYLTDAQRADMERQLAEVRGKTREEYARNLGRGYSMLPEHAELSNEEIGRLKAAVEGLPEDEVLTKFNAVMVDLIAERRAHKLHESWKQKDLGQEREALRREESAKLVQSQQSPDMAQSKGLPPVTDVRAMSDKEFDAYWARIRNQE